MRVAPFGSEGQYAGLRLQHLEATTAPDPFWGAFEQTGDSEAFGTACAITTVIVALHGVALASLGAHEVVAAAMAPAVLASAATDMPHVDAAVH